MIQQTLIVHKNCINTPMTNSFANDLALILDHVPSNEEIILYKTIYNPYLERLSELKLIGNIKTDIFACPISTNNSNKQPASDIIIKSVLETTSGGFEVTALNAFMLLPNVETEQGRRYIDNIQKQIYTASDLLNVPVISANAWFNAASEHEALICISALSEKCNSEYIQQSNNLVNTDNQFRKLFFCYCENNMHSISDFAYKLIKESFLELLKLPHIQLYYSFGTIADLLAKFCIQSEFNGHINVGQIPFCNQSYDLVDSLYVSANKGFLLQVLPQQESNMRHIIQKWNLKYCLLSENYPDEPIIISHPSSGILKIERHVIKSISEIFQIEKPPFEPSFKNIRHPKTTIETILLREQALKYLTRPNVASKRWLKDQLPRFSGMNNPSVNFHSDSPIVKTRNGQFVCCSVYSCIPNNNSTLTETIINTLLKLYCEITATGAQPQQTNICFIISA